MEEPLKPKPNQKSGNSPDSVYRAFGIFGAVGIQLALSVAVGAYLGNWADARWGTAPWLMMLGVVLGAAAGFYNLILLLKRTK